MAGVPLRSGDVQREEIVAKGELVTIVYEAPGILITMRGRVNESGAMGDVVSVTNPQSKARSPGHDHRARPRLRQAGPRRIASAQ